MEPRERAMEMGVVLLVLVLIGAGIYIDPAFYFISFLAALGGLVLLFQKSN